MWSDAARLSNLDAVVSDGATTPTTAPRTGKRAHLSKKVENGLALVVGL